MLPRRLFRHGKSVIAALALKPQSGWLNWLLRGVSDVVPDSIGDAEEKRMLTAFQKVSRSDQQALTWLAESAAKK